MSLPEFFVLSTVGYDIVLAPQELAQWTVGEARGDPRGEFPVREFEVAIASCIGKQWLRVLSEGDCLLDEKRRRVEAYPMCTVSAYMPGRVDFTPEGASHYYGFQKQLFELYGYPASHVGSNTDTPGRIDVYSDADSLLTRHLREIQQSPSDFVGGGALIVEVTPAMTMGPWWRNRFELIQSGLHASVLYADA